MSTAEIVESVLNPFTECLTPEAATQDRLSALAAKADAGQLNEDERND